MCDNYYDLNAKEFFDGTVNADMTPNYKEFLDMLPDNSIILDAGCGSGRDTLMFKSLGYEVVAIDGSLEMCKLASEYTSQEVLHINFQNMAFDNIFDGIWASASLLHVPSEEMNLVLSNFKKALKDEGILHASFKQGDFEGIRNGRFFNDFTQDSAIDLFKNSNFNVIKTWITADSRPDRADEKWVNILVKK